MLQKHQREIDGLKAELLTIKENGSLPNQAVLENKEIKGETILQTKHERIVCDKCYACPIYGNRYKHLDSMCYDLCEKCHKENPVNDPVIEFKAPGSLSQERFQDY